MLKILAKLKNIQSMVITAEFHFKNVVNISISFYLHRIYFFLFLNDVGMDILYRI